jgi:filamentous hemagglutinin family protein
MAANTEHKKNSFISLSMKKRLKAASSLSVPILSFAGAVLMALPAYAEMPTPDQLPHGPEVVTGSITMQTSGNILNMHQSTNLALVKWQSLSSGENTQTNIYQDGGTSSLSVHQDLSPDITAFMGGLWSNGKVMILDRQGIIYGDKTKIDVHSIVTSTGDVNICMATVSLNSL